MGFFKSKEEKEKEKNIKNERIKQVLYTYKLLLESDSISLVNSLIEDYISIFSIYGTKYEAQKFLKNELVSLLSNFNIDNTLEINYLDFNAKKYNDANFAKLTNKLDLKKYIDAEESSVIYSFQSILKNNIDSIIDDQNLTIRCLQEIESKNIFEATSYVITYLMTLPILIVYIFSKALTYKTLITENKDNEKLKGLVSIIQNISRQEIESNNIINNVYNINVQLYKDDQQFCKLDIYIYILLYRKNPIIENYKLLVDKRMLTHTITLLDDLEIITRDKNTLNNIRILQKNYIDNYFSKSFVTTDKYKIQYLDYYICILLIDKDLISLDTAINFTIEGFITEDYENTYLLKKALWDNERYLNNDFSLELQIFNLMQKYENIQNGYEFEEFCFSLYTELGYFVEHTKLSNDQGADLVIEKEGIRSVVQAKFYSTPVGNKAVQEVVASKAYYENAPHAIVITNNIFTPSAKKLAEANSVQLVIGDNIIEYIKSLT